jgi:uncharacterized protein
VTWKPLARVLMRKSKQALKLARLALNARDYDGAVNRSYYAMFDIARAALLKDGVAESKLPRTHNGISEAFRLHAVQSGRIDHELGAALSRTESLRIKADYTDLEVEPKLATETVERAELFVQTVERVFSLDEYSLSAEGDDHDPDQDRGPDRDDLVSEPGVDVSKIEGQEAHLQPISLEEERRQARENWLRLRQQQIHGAKVAEPRRRVDRSAGRDRGAGEDHNAGEDRGLSLTDDVDE